MEWYTDSDTDTTPEETRWTDVMSLDMERTSRRDITWYINVADNLVMLGIPLPFFLAYALGKDVTVHLRCNVVGVLQSFTGYFSVSLLVALNCERLYMIFRTT